MQPHGEMARLCRIGLLGGAVPWRVAIGGAITRTSVSEWYQGMAKPSFNPPDWTFTPVWISLFILMGVSAWLVWRRTGFAHGAVPLACVRRSARLESRLVHSLLRVRLGWVGAGRDCHPLDRRPDDHDRLLPRQPACRAVARPYLLWLSFAVALNASIWWLNRL